MSWTKVGLPPLQKTTAHPIDQTAPSKRICPWAGDCRGGSEVDTKLRIKSAGDVSQDQAQATSSYRLSPEIGLNRSAVDPPTVNLSVDCFANEILSDCFFLATYTTGIKDVSIGHPRGVFIQWTRADSYIHGE